MFMFHRGFRSTLFGKGGTGRAGEGEHLTLVSWQQVELIWADVLSSSVAWTLWTPSCRTTKTHSELSPQKNTNRPFRKDQAVLRTLVIVATLWLAFLL